MNAHDPRPPVPQRTGGPLRRGLRAVVPSAYARLLRVRDVRRLVLVGMVARLPHTAAGLVLTLLVVQDRGRGYAEAGAVAAVFTVGMAVGAPWRGRLVDRVGLRRALVASIVGEAVLWPLAGVVPYPALFPVVAAAGLFALPVFSVVRKSLSVLVPPDQRRSAFALDSVLTEMVFMVGPAVGVWAATVVGAPLVLTVVGLGTAVAGLLLWWYDPPLTSVVEELAEPEPTPGTRDRALARRPRSWVTFPVVALLVAASAGSVAVAGTDLAVLSSLRELDEVGHLGLVYAAWCAASAVGGLVYGAMRRPVDPLLLVLLLGVLTVPLALAGSVGTLALLVVPAGLACSPVMAATADAVARRVPAARRGEAMGWQGSALTLGSALGSPLAGAAIDRSGAGAGFLAVAAVAVVVALAGTVGRRVARRRYAEPLTGPL